jgi:hypothetical protein
VAAIWDARITNLPERRSFFDIANASDLQLGWYRRRFAAKPD